MRIKNHSKLIIASLSTIIIIICLFFFISTITFLSPAKEQWYLNDNPKRVVNINFQDMWSIYNHVPAKSKSDVNLAIIDTGIDYNNLEIQDSLTTKDDSFIDNNGHGTKIAGIICASQNKGNVVGVADSKHVKIFPIKVISDDKSNINNSCSIKDLISAITQAEKAGCQICNISLNCDTYDSNLESIIANSKMLFIVSAGNDYPRGRDIDAKPSYPASFVLPNLITVTNIKANGRLAKNANYGQCVDIAAPGTEIYSIDLDNQYSVSSGTSYATPMVTGIAAMIYICDCRMTANRCKDIIMCSCEHMEQLNGSINSNNLVQLDQALKLIATKGGAL